MHILQCTQNNLLTALSMQSNLFAGSTTISDRSRMPIVMNIDELWDYVKYVFYVYLGYKYKGDCQSLR